MEKLLTPQNCVCVCASGVHAQTHAHKHTQYSFMEHDFPLHFIEQHLHSQAKILANFILGSRYRNCRWFVCNSVRCTMPLQNERHGKKENDPLERKTIEESTQRPSAHSFADRRTGRPTDEQTNTLHVERKKEKRSYLVPSRYSRFHAINGRKATSILSITIIAWESWPTNKVFFRSRSLVAAANGPALVRGESS